MDAATFRIGDDQVGNRVLAIGLLVWLNLRVQTKVEPGTDELPRILQTMGWPLTIFTAGEPEIGAWAQAQSQTPREADYLRYLQDRPDLRWRCSHWSFANIALNVAIGVLLVLIALLAWQRLAHKSAQSTISNAS